MRKRRGLPIRQEARDSLRQAEEDYKTARVNIDTGRYYASVFFSQQCAEKALKAGCIQRLRRLPQEHNLIVLSRQLEAPEEVLGAARELNPEYLTTRYIDAANGVPADIFDAASAKLHLKCARVILRWSKGLLRL